MVVAIEEIKEEGPEQAITEITCDIDNLYGKSIEGNVLKVEVPGQLVVISRSITSLNQTLIEHEEEKIK